MKVLIVGGAGYLGGKTTDILIENGFECAVYDNLLYEDRYLKPVKFFFGDIRDTDNLVSVANDYDAIVLMSALVGDPACSINPMVSEEINYKAIKNFCQKISDDKFLIFMSTCSVYGAQDGILDEYSKVNPLSIYAKTKLEAEKWILDKNGIIFRLGTVFGVGDTYSRIRLDLVVNILTYRAFKYGEITINGGEQWRPIISVIDVANYIAEACDKGYRGVYILSKENTTIKLLGDKVLSIIPAKIKHTEISFQDARNYRVDNLKSLHTFTYKPYVTVEDEVKKMLDLFTSNRVKNPENILYHNGQYLKDIL